MLFDTDFTWQICLLAMNHDNRIFGANKTGYFWGTKNSLADYC